MVRQKITIPANAPAERDVPATRGPQTTPANVASLQYPDPIYRSAPTYPRRALSQGLAGWVILEFTVTEAGAVKDAFVVDNCAWTKPISAGECYGSRDKVFDNSALATIMLFRYEPKIANGVRIEMHGVRHKMTWQLAE